MRPVFKVFMIGAAVALLVPALPAQPPGFGPGGGVLGLFSNKDVQKALKLTDKQKEDLKGKIEELRKKQTSALKDAGTDPMELFKKQAALGSESVEGAVKLLTDDQKKAWKDLVGEPFEFKTEKAPEKKEPAK